MYTSPYRARVADAATERGVGHFRRDTRVRLACLVRARERGIHRGDVRKLPVAADMIEVRMRVEHGHDVLASELRPYRIGASLFSAAALLALLVAAAGVYSSIAYSISTRTHEMGVRIALGARTRNILQLVVLEGLRVVLLGIAIGTLIAVAAGRSLSAFMYCTTPHDPVVLTTVATVLIAVAVVASLAPALRATGSDPADALRSE